MGSWSCTLPRGGCIARRSGQRAVFSSFPVLFGFFQIKLKENHIGVTVIVSISGLF